jgi:hypothetical protein
MSGGTSTAGLITCLFIAAVAFLGIITLAPPAAVPASAPPSEFSSGRAMQHLQVIAQAAHPIGSPEHARVRDYIVKTLTDLGVQPEVQQTTSTDPWGFSPSSAGTVRNIIARLPGTASRRATCS